MNIFKWFYLTFIKRKSLIEYNGHYAVRYRFGLYQDFITPRFKWTLSSEYFQDCLTTKEIAEEFFSRDFSIKIIK